MKRACDILLFGILLLVAYEAFGQSFTCPAGSAITFSCGAAPVNPPAPIPTPTPTPTPQPTNCTGSPDLFWTPFKDVQLWPVPPLVRSGAGGSVAFVADAGTYPKGVNMGIVDQSEPAIGKDYVVSACPHDFTPVGGNSLCVITGAGSTGGPIYIRFGPAQSRHWMGQTLPTLDCPLTPGGTYYINFRDSTGAGGPVSSQFVIYNRTD